MKACIFDLDGVIVDTAGYHFKAWRRLANELGFDFTEHQNEQLKGISRVESLEKILDWGGVTLSETEKIAWAAKKNDWYLENIQAMNTDEVLPGVIDFLEHLQKNEIKIALGSASKNAKLILERTLMLPFFDALIDGNQTNRSKPDPQVFSLGAEALGLAPEECIVFEDAVAGVEAAHRAGMKSVGVGSVEVLSNANWVISSFVGVKYTDFL